MKKGIKLFIMSAILVLSISIANAQTTFTTNEVRQFMSKGEQNGIEIILNGTKLEDAKDAVEKFGKKLKAKVVRDKKSPEIFIDNAVVPTVSANTVDMYVIVTPVDNGSKVTFFSDLGGAFVSSAAYGTQYAGLEALIKKFAKEQAIVVVEDQQKAEEKVLKTLNGDLKDLVGKKEDYVKEIEKAKALIQQREADIQKNDADQAAKQQQISLQQQIIETVKSKRASLNY
jgi:TPP-dependent indolepyruvate ferredoxin oxidoreductase alpha subunit